VNVATEQIFYGIGDFCLLQASDQLTLTHGVYQARIPCTPVFTMVFGDPGAKGKIE